MDKAMKDALIDRPALVVDEQAIDDALNELACIGWSDSAMEPNEVAVAKAKDAILSAVNAVCLTQEAATLRTRAEAAESRVMDLEAEVAHLRRVEAGAVRQADELAAMRGVVVKELEWDGVLLDGEVAAAEPYLGPRYTILPSDDTGFVVRTGTGAGYFDGSRRYATIKDAKAACEKQWQTSVRQLLRAQEGGK